jgi:4-hydroxy-2-oxoheptanedioate aldolase
LNLPRNAVDGERSFEHTREVLVKAKRAGLTTVVGGGVTAATLDFVRRLPPGLLDRYETRKICFDCPAALGEEAPAGIELALEFELYWLANKRAYHRAIALEDEKRIAALQVRLGTTVL